MLVKTKSDSLKSTARKFKLLDIFGLSHLVKFNGVCKKLNRITTWVNTKSEAGLAAGSISNICLKAMSWTQMGSSGSPSSVGKMSPSDIQTGGKGAVLQPVCSETPHRDSGQEIVLNFETITYLFSPLVIFFLKCGDKDHRD